MKKMIIGASMLGLISLVGCASTASPPPATTPDGLELIRSDKHSAVYMKPDAQLESYAKFGIVPCQVAFRKNWQRDYNSAHRSSSQQVKQRDIDRIKTELGEECTAFFTNALGEAPAYDLVTEWQEGEAVLLVFPNIVNLDITSPDLQSPNMSRTYSASAGSMTMYLELIDAETSDVLVRAYDSKADPDTMVNYANKITNRQAADRMLKDWSSRLRSAMDAVLGGRSRSTRPSVTMVMQPSATSCQTTTSARKRPSCRSSTPTSWTTCSPRSMSVRAMQSKHASACTTASARASARSARNSASLPRPHVVS